MSNQELTKRKQFVSANRGENRNIIKNVMVAACARSIADNIFVPPKPSENLQKVIFSGDILLIGQVCVPKRLIIDFST